MSQIFFYSLIHTPIWLKCFHPLIFDYQSFLYFSYLISPLTQYLTASCVFYTCCIFFSFKVEGWDSWMSSSTQWTWTWTSSGRYRGQESLVCCSPWGCRELDTTWRLNNKSGSYKNRLGYSGSLCSLKSGFKCYPTVFSRSYRMKGLREVCNGICTHPSVNLAWMFILLSGTYLVNIFFLFDIFHICKHAHHHIHTHNFKRKKFCAHFLFLPI